jgi:hypothetical protein
MRVIAFDPGLKGYCVELDSEAQTARCLKLPFRPDGIICYRSIKKVIDFKTADLCILEKVSAQKKWAASSALTFGKIVGQLQMLLSSCSFAEVAPATWQKHMFLGFADHMEPKVKALASFQRINPNYEARKKRIDDNLVDAFLMACFGLKSSNVNFRIHWKFEHHD